MEESKKISLIGECFCLKSPYKHFIIASLEESIEKREGEIYIIKKGREEMKKIKGIIGPEQAEAAINMHRSTNEELIKVRDMVSDIPSCKT